MARIVGKRNNLKAATRMVDNDSLEGLRDAVDGHRLQIFGIPLDQLWREHNIVLQHRHGG